MPNQYENPDNILAHVETTGPEIFEQTAGEVDYFVAGMGTTGTLMGTGRYLKSVKPGCSIVGVEPVMGHAIQGLKNMTESMVPGIFRRTSWTTAGWSTTTRRSTRPAAWPAPRACSSAPRAAPRSPWRCRSPPRSTRAPSSCCCPDRGDRYLSTMQFRSICAKCPA